MGVFDKEWNRLVKRVLEEGYDQPDELVYSKYRNGEPAKTKYLIDEHMSFTDGSVLAIAQNKFIDTLKPLREMELFWKLKSNRVEDLRVMGTKIWDDWEIKGGEWDGTIGPSYGFLLGVNCKKYHVEKLHWDLLDPRKTDLYKESIYDEDGNVFVKLDQVDYLIQELKNNPGSRYHVTSIWDVNLLDQMALKPCVWSTTWKVTPDNKLHLRLHIRSNDLALGNPYNIYQYNVLRDMLAQVLGYEPGSINVDIMDAHLYDAHIPNVEKQLMVETDLPEAWLELNPEVKNFYLFDMEKDVIIHNVNPNAPVFKYPIAIS